LSVQIVVRLSAFPARLIIALLSDQGTLSSYRPCSRFLIELAFGQAHFLIMNSAIFKAYDVRGIYPDAIDEAAAYAIGRAYIMYTKAGRVAVGRDIRESSPALFENLVRGLADGGADVYDLGLATTPMVYFASGVLDVDGGIMLTASHNPAAYNGMKFCRRQAVPIGEGSGLEEIKRIALAGNFPAGAAKGQIIKSDIKEDYFRHLLSFANLGGRKFKIVADFANAMGILEMEIYRRLADRIELVPLYDEFDSAFPNHEANPLKLETLKDVQAKVTAEKADLGVAYDGDGDRVGFVDEQGEIIPMDFITAIVAEAVLEKNPGATILFDLRSSMAVREIIEERGGIAKECRVGHALIKRQMRELGAVFAGELSGHYYFQENFLAEAGSLPVIYILNLLAETGQSISAIAGKVRRYFHSGEINSEAADKEAVLAKLKEIYQAGELDELDGIKISFWNNPLGRRWWFNVRPSNTEPLLRLNLEADSPALMAEKRNEILKIIRN